MSSLAISKPTVKRRPPLVRLLLEVDGVLYQVHRFATSPALIRAGAVLQRVADGELFDVATVGESLVCRCGRFGAFSIIHGNLCPHLAGMVEAALLPRYPSPMTPPRPRPNVPDDAHESNGESNGVYSDLLLVP